MATMKDHLPGCSCKDCAMLSAATDDSLTAALPAHEPPPGPPKTGILI